MSQPPLVMVHSSMSGGEGRCQAAAQAAGWDTSVAAELLRHSASNRDEVGEVLKRKQSSPSQKKAPLASSANHLQLTIVSQLTTAPYQ